MINVTIPYNHIPERSYALSVLLGEFLGLDYHIETLDEEKTTFTLSNGKKLVIADHFFNKVPAKQAYLSSENIPVPKFISSADIPFYPGDELPILFGSEEFRETQEGIFCGSDITATLFFMLSRWEEYVNTKRDKHQRFPAKEAISVKYNFHHRPIADEYVEWVWNMLKHLGISQKRRDRKFRAIITHDVDFPLQWRSPFSLVRKMGGDLLKRASINQAFASLSNYIQVKKGKAKDPFDTFDYLMDLSEEKGLQSHFFFLSGGKHAMDKGHLPPMFPFMVNLMKKIDRRGHVIGFHPSYETYKNGRLFHEELVRLQQYSPQEIKCGRQHFLRFENPGTWKIWEENGMEWDSSHYFPEEAGFRCGTCHEFPVFDIVERKMLRLKEKPLTVMDMTYLAYSGKTPEKAFSGMISLLKQVQQFNGQFGLLWHNTSFNSPEWWPFRGVYTKLLQELTP